MAKTIFQAGTRVTSAFLNSIFAHVHDAGTTDGHVAKIDSIAHIAGMSSGTFNAIFSCFSSPITVTCAWTKNAANLVVLSIPAISGTSNSSEFHSDYSLPYEIAPLEGYPSILCPVIDNSVQMIGNFSISEPPFNPGSFRINIGIGIIGCGALTLTSSGFTTSGIKGISQLTVCYFGATWNG